MNIIILISSFLGILVAYYIDYHKTKNKPLVCPLKADCEKVIHSSYSKILNISVEKLGIFYYIFIFISYLFYQITNFNNLIFNFVLFGLSFLAFIFSVYLTSIQIFKIKEFCSWCLLSAFLSFLIFLNSYFLYQENIILIIQTLKIAIF